MMNIEREKKTTSGRLRIQTTDRHPKNHLTHTHTPLPSHLYLKLRPATYYINIKIFRWKNCAKTKRKACFFSNVEDSNRVSGPLEEFPMRDLLEKEEQKHWAETGLPLYKYR